MAAAQEVVAGCQNGGSENGGSKAVGFNGLKPFLIVPAPMACDAVKFYKDAFGAEELERSVHPKRKADQDLPLLAYAHLKLGPAELFVSDETEDAGVKSNATLGGTSLIMWLETEDMEGAIAKAVKAGATVEAEVSDTPCGAGRYGKVKDPFGYIWAISTPCPVAAATPADVSGIGHEDVQA
ncbi:hypothetical protein AMTRI_Chr06g196270 [Amborella trichopoda]